MRHLPGSTGQAANSRMICTYLPSLLPTTLVLCYPRMEWPSSRMGWPYLQLHWQDTATVGHVFTSRCTSIPQTCCFRYTGWPTSICFKKLESWWVAHWLPNQIRVPLVVTNVSQLHDTIMWVCSVRLISYQWYSRFLLFNMSRRWRKSAHCEGTTNIWITIQHEIHMWLCQILLRSSKVEGEQKQVYRMLASVLINPRNSLWSVLVCMVVLIMKNGDAPFLQILNSSSAMFELWYNLVTFNQLMDCVLHGLCWSRFCFVGRDNLLSWRFIFFIISVSTICSWESMKYLRTSVRLLWHINLVVCREGLKCDP